MPVETGRARRAKDPAREIASAVVESTDHIKLELLDIRTRDGAVQFKLNDSDNHVAWFEMEPGDTIRVTGSAPKRQDSAKKTTKATSSSQRRGQLILDQRFTLQSAGGTDREVIAIERDKRDVRLAVAGSTPDSMTWRTLRPGDRVKCRASIPRPEIGRNDARGDSGQPLSLGEIVVAQITRSVSENGNTDIEAVSNQSTARYSPSKYHRSLEELLAPAPPPPQPSFTANLRTGGWIKKALICLVLFAPIMLSGWHITKSWASHNPGSLRRPVAAEPINMYPPEWLKSPDAMPPPGIYPGFPLQANTQVQIPHSP